jgi:formylglycine-generating enzyme required for sulfatase activity
MAAQDDIQKLITEHRRRLQKLRERQAKQGINTPPEVLTEIEDIEAQIDRLRTELEEEQSTLRQTLQSLAPTSPVRQPVEERLAAIEQHLKSVRAASPVFDQRGQQVGTQYNVAGDLIQQAAPPPVADPAVLRRGYLNRLLQQTRRLPLTGVDPKAAGDESSRELQLSAVYTALMTYRPNPEEEIVTESGQRIHKFYRFSALEVLNRDPRLVLLGDPGSGKSTFVNFVALCLAGEGLGDEQANLAVLTAPLPVEDEREEEKEAQPQPWDRGPLLPVRIVLRDLAARGLPEPDQPVGGDTLWSFIKTELGETLGEYAPHLKKELQEKGGLILLDGLDEVPDARQRRVQVKQIVQGFAHDFPLCRFLVTSRTYAYQRQDWKLDGFVEVVLSPFTPGQITRFVDGWYAHIGQVRDLNPEDAQGQATLLKTAIERSERLSELAARPLLLTLMASLHAWRGGSLPEKREELYHDAVDLLLDQWESPKVVRDAAGQPLLRQPSLAEWLKVDKDVVRAELNRLAFAAHRDQPQLVGTADVAQERLVSALLAVARNPDTNPARLVEYIRDRAGLLAARGEGVYTFPHRTFQEYLAACHLTDTDYPDQIVELVRADPQRWREATLLAGAKSGRGTSLGVWALAEALCCHEPPAEGRADIDSGECWGALLAAQVLQENEGTRLAQVSERNAPKLERIRGWLLAIVSHGWLPPVDRAQAGEALAMLGDERDFEELVTIPAGLFLMGADDMTSDERPRHELTLPEYRIGKYPVTNAQYRRFVETTKREWPSGRWQRSEKANCPVVVVSWHDALAYCGWLTGVWREQGKIAAGEIVRLPTEAEWEKAARGTDGRIYPWGNEWDETKCNTSELGLGDTCAVGMFAGGASPYGCLDMAGNVWEWTGSLWGKGISSPEFKYPYDPTDGRENLEAGDNVLRVLRGGSFDVIQRDARCAYRWYDPYLRYDYYGFRVVVSPISPTSAL